jgi:xanthosine utilization system XapX-like protein
MNTETLTTVLLYVVGGFIILLTLIWAFVGYQVYRMIKLVRGGISVAQNEIHNVSRIFNFVKNKFTSSDHDTDTDNQDRPHRKI